jgi:hypothetical protein
MISNSFPAHLSQGKTRDEILKSLTKWSILKKEFSSMSKKSDRPTSRSPTIPRSIKPEIPANTFSTNSVFIRVQETPSYSFGKESRFDNSIFEKLKSKNKQTGFFAHLPSRLKIKQAN